MDHLQSALVFWKKSKADNYRKHIADIYIEMGWVYLDYGFGHEQNAMQVFGRALSKTKRISNLVKDGPSRVVKALNGMGVALYDVGDWDLAIELFEKSLVACNEAVAHIYLGYVYLEKCLRLPPDTDGYVRADVMDCALGHDMMNQYKKLSKIGVSMALYSESEGIFLGVKLEVLRRNIDGAKTSIKQLFDTEINGYDDDVVYCHCCNQRHGESVELKKCAGCKVRYYCSKRHQKDKWRGRFIDHRMLCPYLNRWRRVKRRMKKEERSRDTLDSILNDFVEVIERVYINKYGVFIPGK
jgi:tetratricopeptide (TPR) repeat protein